MAGWAGQLRLAVSFDHGILTPVQSVTITVRSNDVRPNLGLIKGIANENIRFYAFVHLKNNTRTLPYLRLGGLPATPAQNQTSKTPQKSY